MGRIKYLEALGLEVKRGRPPTGQASSKVDPVKLYVKEGRAVREKGICGTARGLAGVDEGTVRYHLKVRRGR